MRAMLILLSVLLAASCAPGPSGLPVCQQALPTELGTSDCDKDGGLSYSEALSFGAIDGLNSTPRPYTQQEFDAADSDRSGKLTIAELHKLLTTTYCWATAARACPIAKP